MQFLIVDNLFSFLLKGKVADATYQKCLFVHIHSPSAMALTDYLSECFNSGISCPLEISAINLISLASSITYYYYYSLAGELQYLDLS